MNAELVTVWSGSLEAEAVRAQQRTPDPLETRRPPPCAPVLAYVAKNPGATSRQIGEATGLTPGQVHAALVSLLDRGFVSRSPRQVEQPNQAVRWTAK